jgi:hypothetical protein
MNEIHQLASALLTLVFAAMMFVVGHFYTENRSTRNPGVPAIQASSLDKPSIKSGFDLAPGWP